MSTDHLEDTALDIAELIEKHGTDWFDTDSIKVFANEVVVQKYGRRKFRITVEEE